jgi:positive regulator of sigma E activity
MDPSSIALVAFSSAIVVTALSFIAVVNYKARCTKREEPAVVTLNTIEVKMPDWR